MIHTDSLVKEIDEVIQQIASDSNLYGLEAEEVQAIWMDALLQKISQNDKLQAAH